MNYTKSDTFPNPEPTHTVTAYDQFGKKRDVSIAGEIPLTIFVDGNEVVTLMTLGTHPEELAVGYLRNQRLMETPDDIADVTVDWELERVSVTTHKGQGIVDLAEKLAHRTITSGCGQGTVFSCSLDKLYEHRLPDTPVKQSVLYSLLNRITKRPTLYKTAGAVHGCALCRDDEVLIFIEDVGRHNAADTIAGMMWQQNIEDKDLIFYTTGRLTSEIVMKAAYLGTPILLSRSGITEMGLELARDLNITMIARAKGSHFLVYNNREQVVYDAMPEHR